MEAHDHSAHASVAHASVAHDETAMHLLCDGTVESGRHGSWKGHVYPGALFIIWGSWWALNTIALYLARSPRRPYRGQPWFPLALRWCRLMEPGLKVAISLLAIAMELYLDHFGVYQNLYCPAGTKFAGRFALSNLNNWQHALSYPGFVLSGIVDITGAFMPLPAGTEQAVLGSVFAAASFIMFTHEKHDPQDKAVHWLLAVAMMLSTLAVLGEMAAQRSVLAGAGKATALLLVGAWLVQIAAIEFEGRPQWSFDYPGGAMFASTVFTFIAVLCLAAVFATFLALALLRRRGWLPLEAVLPEEGEEEQREGDEELLPRRLHHTALHHYDSANHSDDNDAVPLAAAGGGKGGAARNPGSLTPFHIQHNHSDSADVYV